jgi:hypothetical protein
MPAEPVEDGRPELLVVTAVQAASGVGGHPSAMDARVATRRLDLDAAHGRQERRLGGTGQELVAHAAGQRNRHQLRPDGLVEASAGGDVDGDAREDRRGLLVEEGGPDDGRHSEAGIEMLGKRTEERVLAPAVRFPFRGRAQPLSLREQREGGERRRVDEPRCSVEHDTEDLALSPRPRARLPSDELLHEGARRRDARASERRTDRGLALARVQPSRFRRPAPRAASLDPKTMDLLGCLAIPLGHTFARTSETHIPYARTERANAPRPRSYG